MKTINRTQINPIHRDLIIATLTGFTMAVIVILATVIVIA
jgi:hypothetical protein